MKNTKTEMKNSIEGLENILETFSQKLEQKDQ